MTKAVKEALAALELSKNVILEGPPGTGKSFAVAEIAGSWPRRLLGAGDGKNGR